VPNRILPGEFYAEALYECSRGFNFDPPELRTLYCAEGEWIGRKPHCVVDDGGSSDANPCIGEDAAKCEHTCALDDAGFPMCGCHEGYVVSGDEGDKCLDVDECDDGSNGGCVQLCVNKPGAFMCDCLKGYRVQESVHSDV
jgi:hypothetical protein